MTSYSAHMLHEIVMLAFLKLDIGTKQEFMTPYKKQKLISEA